MSKDGTVREVGVRDRGLPVDERRAWLLDHLGAHGSASVAELSELFGVSTVTVRTDLQALAESRLVRRTHGGAVLLPTGSRAEAGADPDRPGRPDPAVVTERPTPGPRDAREARAIAAAAAELVSSGDTLLLDGGLTALWLARALLRRRDLRSLTICTNDLDLAVELRPAVPRFTVVLAGGSVSAGGTLVEPLVGPALERIRGDLCFLGCAGVDAAGGVTGTDLGHAAVWQRYRTGAGRAVLLAPGSAVGHRDRVLLAGVEDLDLLVTARSAGPALDGLRNAGLQVVVVD